MRVLFVDDEPNILSGLRRILRGQRKEWEMSFVEGGQPALDVMDETPCDVIVSDMKMPGMDGAELLSRIRSNFPATIRIALSGETDSHMIYRCVKHAHQYLAKPCDADALISAVQRAFRLRDLVQDEKLEAVVADMTSLPSMPEQYEKIMQEMQSDDPSLQKIGEIIETDVAMSAKILQLVNSAFFGLARHLSSPAEAAMYLGVDVLKSLVLTTGVFSQFDSESVDASTVKRIWDHSTEVGSLAKSIATSQSDQKLVSDYALMGGLLADIGKLVFATNFSEKFTEVANRMADENRRDFEVEEELFGHSHSDVGAYLVGLWGLPNPVVECVAYHHAPLACAASGFTALTAVHAADAIVRADGDEELPHLDKEYIEQLGLTAEIPGWVQKHAESRAEGGGA
jgi:putative nucleotidyltransferase with HDIG domain